MRNRSGRRAGWAAAGALAAVVWAPGLAQAQVTGLFPLSPIRRERVPCQAEDPVYKLYRQQYFGYHPTCWRRFPAGWGCPSPEAPNAARSFDELKRRSDPGDPGRGMDPNLTEPETPEGAPTDPGMGDAPRRGQQEPLPPLPDSPRSLFPGNARETTPPTPDEPAPTNPRGAAAMEGLPPLPGETAAEAAPAPVTSAPAPANFGEPADSPLLALPDPTVPPNPNGPTANVAPSYAPRASAAPVQAPRRGLLGGLFNNISLLRR